MINSRAMNGRRVATASGAILADAALLDAAGVGGSSSPASRSSSPRFWAGHGDIAPVGVGGRGAAWFIDHGAGQWVLRHYRRGGFVARLSQDRYLWTGEARVRAFAEYRLLADLAARGLPVPEPVAARYERRGPWYRCDLITRRIAGSSVLERDARLRPVGRCLVEPRGVDDRPAAHCRSRPRGSQRA